MYNTKIDWADTSWNPVTGCLHGCEYCFARGIAERFSTEKMLQRYQGHILTGLSPKIVALDTRVIRDARNIASAYPFGFTPTLHRYRLDDPKKWQKPRTIFVCSMADLFGDWVPDEWIMEVFKACEAAPGHRYLFLTKNPKRYEELLQGYTPPNMWFGWSQDGPVGDSLKFSTHPSVKVFVSLEPLLRPFTDYDVRGLDWAIVGAETGKRKDKVVPEKKWIDDIAAACAENGVPLFMKGSLREIMGNDFKQEFPWGD